MSDRLWDLFVESMAACFLPLVCLYHAICGNVFLNVEAENATKLEWLGNQILAPTQYLLAGKEAIKKEDGSWEFIQRFEYKKGFWIKSAASFIVLPSSLVVGSFVKGLSFLDPETKNRHDALVAAKNSTVTRSNFEKYQKMGLIAEKSSEEFISLGCTRRPGDENTLKIEKEALADIGKLLNAAKITWWLDCGTCLGAYRYGGVIPWDDDVDIAVLVPDFDNVLHALNALDQKKYIVQDWSSRDLPKSYIKVYVRETGHLIDIYHFAIDPAKNELSYILSLETNMFFPEWWKTRERRFKAPVAFDVVFPLKRAQFDGIEVFVPNDTKKFLQRYYGENLDPVKIYNPITNAYEKDLSHPYWQRAHVH